MRGFFLFCSTRVGSLVYIYSSFKVFCNLLQVLTPDECSQIIAMVRKTLLDMIPATHTLPRTIWPAPAYALCRLPKHTHTVPRAYLMYGLAALTLILAPYVVHGLDMRTVTASFTAIGHWLCCVG